MNRLAEALEQPEATLAVVVTEPLSDEVIRNIVNVADVVEFRADKFPNQDFRHLVQQAGRLATLPLLLTIRHQSEDGNWAGDEEDRLNLFTDLLPFVDGIDIELHACVIPTLVERAHASDKIVIASSHNFEHTPSNEALEKTLVEALTVGADYTKIAASARTIDDYQLLANFTMRHIEDKVIVVAMDDYGPLSRIVLPSIGSHLTYASAGNVAVAPGQMGYIETAVLLNRLYPSHTG